MQQYLARRILLFIPTLFLASLAIFVVMRVLPGDVALIILGGEESSASAMEQLDALREELGLKDPLPVQYGEWAWSMVNGEFGGRSVLDREPLAEILARRLPVTLQLTFYTILISIFISTPLGVIAAIYQNRWPDYIIRLTSVAGHAPPQFLDCPRPTPHHAHLLPLDAPPLLRQCLGRPVVTLPEVDLARPCAVVEL